MEILIIAAILGCIPGAIASSKGRSFLEWWIYGTLLFIVALIHSLCIRKDHKAIEQSQLKEGLVKCPYCAEAIKPEAVKCKHCGSDVSGIAAISVPITEKNNDGTRIRVDRVLILIGVIVVVIIVVSMTRNN